MKTIIVSLMTVLLLSTTSYASKGRNSNEFTHRDCKKLKKELKKALKETFASLDAQVAATGNDPDMAELAEEMKGTFRQFKTMVLEACDRVVESSQGAAAFEAEVARIKAQLGLK